MSRTRITALTVALAVAALTSCSSGGSEDGAGKPITKQLGQGEITQALPGTGEVLPGWEPYKGKRVTSDGTYCSGLKEKTSPKGWVRGGSAWFIYNGSTDNMMDVDICLYDTAENATSAYAAWKGTESDKEQAPKKKVGEETVFVLNPGLSENTVYAFSRSGNVNIRVKLDGAGGDTTGAQDMLAAALKRLQQVQDGERPTATAGDEAAKTRKK
ncbi:hypothetical protein ABZ419_04090 [Streptomyces cinnamoneus]|uniref:hypothetical protein n=1 Tax=Streptomyces cinnamoneus TaxID=53446 RepID=UPI0033E4805A